MLTAIIGGTGLAALSGWQVREQRTITTPYGEPSAALQFGRFDRGDGQGVEAVFLPRHGNGHRLPPHSVNYRANIWALQQVGVQHVIAINAVGGITPRMGPEVLAVPDQIIDYTWGRESSFSEPGKILHIDFTYPYRNSVRNRILGAAQGTGITVVDGGVYGATQGPRLETAAEIERLARDGCDLVGMTGMPEACLAREAGMDYACLALVVNWAAGRTADEITLEQMQKVIDTGMVKVRTILSALL